MDGRVKSSDTIDLSHAEAFWRSDLDALVFPIETAFRIMHGAPARVSNTAPVRTDTPGLSALFHQGRICVQIGCERQDRTEKPSNRHESSFNESRHRSKTSNLTSRKNRRTRVIRSHTPHMPIAGSIASRLVQSVLAMTLGLFIVGMVGFSHIDVLHNAAHDVRHSNAFPCH
jgi:cobalt transporter subunit CbtB